MKKLNFYAAIAVTVITLWSCQKGDSSESQMSELSVSESVEVMASVDEVEELIDQNIFYADSFLDFSGLTGKGDYHDRSGFFTTCATFEIVTLENSVTVTISFDEGCTDCYGNEISGTITLMRTKENDTYNSSITFTDLTINGYVVNGTKTYTRVAENSNGNPEITGTVDITIVTDAGIITKTGNKSVEVTAGSATDSYLDDEITITGSSIYTSADEIVISAEITTPLVKLAECKYISQGIKEFTNNGAVSVLDYGDGTCDNTATLTDSDGVVTEIELRRGRRNKHHD
tara:strand:+ start:238487 stop:239350 length:864 start_codon:yes stop_codon:yes gene_type:complete